MTLILLEALGAGLLLVLIVWWTMFSGRARGEPVDDTAAQEAPSAPKTPTVSTTQVAPAEDDPKA